MAANADPGEVRELALIIGWLREHPEERALLLWLAERRLDGPGLSAGDIEAINRWAKAGEYRICSCGESCIAYPDGSYLSWPSLQRHKCDLNQPLPAAFTPKPARADERSIPAPKGLTA